MSFELLNRKDAPIKDKEFGIDVKFGFVTSDHIAEIQGILGGSRNPSVTVALYAMRECISELTVNGEWLQPKALGFNINPNGEKARPFLYALSSLVIEELILSDEDAKKSPTPPQTSSQEKTEEAAPTASTLDKG